MTRSSVRRRRTKRTMIVHRVASLARRTSASPARSKSTATATEMTPTIT